MSSDALNAFLDGERSDLTATDEHAIADVLRHLRAAPTPDAGFLNQLERQIASPSRPASKLVTLQPATEMPSGRPSDHRRSFAFAALIAVIVAGAALANLIGHMDHQRRPISGAALPAIVSPQNVTGTPIMVSTLGGNVLFSEPSTSSLALATFFPGTELQLLATKRTDTEVWLELRVVGTQIVGWGRTHPNNVPNQPPTSTPGPSPLLSTDAPPANSGSLAHVAGPVAAWSIPGPDMKSLWTATSADRLTLTGKQTDQFGASWVHVTRQSDGKIGWICQGFLFAIHGMGATPEAMPAAATPRAIPWSGTPSIAIGERAHAEQSLSVWSQPGSGMHVVWRIDPFDEIVTTGAYVKFNGVVWAPIRETSGSPREGWIIADLLAPVTGQLPTPKYASVITAVPVSSPHAVARMHPGDKANVSDDIRIWTRPGPGMKVVWTALTSETLTITGESVVYNGTDWTPIRNDATGEEGWVLSYFLVLPSDSVSTSG